MSAVQERLVSLKDIKEEAAAIFAPLGDDSYEEEARKVLSQPAVIPVLQAFKEQLTAADDVEANKQLIKRIIKENQLKPKEVFMPLRCALSGVTHGPELPFLISIWGREETIKRIDHTLDMIETGVEG